MTNDEYRAWYRSLMARFPSVQQWWERLPEETRRVQSEDWRDALSRESKDDCDGALKQIKQGNAEPWPEFNREMIGAHVARVARSIRFERESRTSPRPSQEGSRAQKRQKHNVKGMFARICELREMGISTEDAAKRVRAEFGTSVSDEGPRFRCLDCRDAGTVECWHPDTITRVLRGDDVRSKYTCAVPCHCPLGTKFITRDGEKTARTFGSDAPRFSQEKHCIVDSVFLPPSEVALIREWAKAVQSQSAPCEWQYT